MDSANANLERYLTSWGKEVIKVAKKKPAKSGKGGGNLEKSLRAVVKETPDGSMEVQFMMADYGTFVDKGVKGAGGTIKTGKHAGQWGGRRWFINYQGKRQDSPYQYGTGTGKKGGMSKGIGSFIRKKGLQPRNEKGQYQTTAGLKIAIMNVIWKKGIHGISFFQNSLMLGIATFAQDSAKAIADGIIEDIKNKMN
jgi:hypothetical protein